MKDFFVFVFLVGFFPVDKIKVCFPLINISYIFLYFHEILSTYVIGHLSQHS